MARKKKHSSITDVIFFFIHSVTAMNHDWRELRERVNRQRIKKMIWGACHRSVTMKRVDVNGAFFFVIVTVILSDKKRKK